MKRHYLFLLFLLFCNLTFSQSSFILNELGIDLNLGASFDLLKFDQKNNNPLYDFMEDTLNITSTKDVYIKGLFTEEDVNEICENITSVRVSAFFLSLKAKISSNTSTVKSKKDLYIAFIGKATYNGIKATSIKINPIAQKLIDNGNYTQLVNDYGNYFISSVDKESYVIVVATMHSLEQDVYKKFEADYSGSIKPIFSISAEVQKNLSTVFNEKISKNDIEFTMHVLNNNFTFNENDVDIISALKKSTPDNYIQEINNVISKNIKSISIRNSPVFRLYYKQLFGVTIPNNVLDYTLLEAKHRRCTEIIDEKIFLQSQKEILNKIKKLDNFQKYSTNADLFYINEVIKKIDDLLDDFIFIQSSLINAKDISSVKSIKLRPCIDTVKTYCEQAYTVFRNSLTTCTAAYIEKYVCNPFASANSSSIFDAKFSQSDQATNPILTFSSSSINATRSFDFSTDLSGLNDFDNISVFIPSLLKYDFHNKGNIIIHFKIVYKKNLDRTPAYPKFSLTTSYYDTFSKKYMSQFSIEFSPTNLNGNLLPIPQLSNNITTWSQTFDGTGTNNTIELISDKIPVTSFYGIGKNINSLDLKYLNYENTNDKVIFIDNIKIWFEYSVN